MTSKFNAITTGAGGVEVTGDSSGEIEFQSNGSTIATVTASGLNVASGLSLGSPIDIASGGTGQTTATASFNALAPSQSGNSGKYLTTDGTNTSWATIASSQWTTSGSNIYYNTGNVGIGTSTPSSISKLHVYDTDGDTRIRLEDTTGFTSLDMVCADGSLNVINFGDASDINIGRMEYDHSTNSMHFDTNNTERMRIDSSGNLKFNSGYGSVATAYGCRAWVNFNGTGTVAIRNSGNVSSITDNGTGLYTLNFTTSMPDVNYTSIGIGGAPASNNQISVSQNIGYSAPTTTSCRYSVTYSNQGLYDALYVGIAIFR